MRIAVVTARGSGGEQGGAERFYQALVSAFCDLGHHAEEVAVTIDEPDFERIKRNYLSCYDLQLQQFDVVVSTKAPTWMIRHPRHVCYLVHTVRVFYDMFDELFPLPSEELLNQRDLIHRLDTLALSPPRCRAVFTIGKEVSDRLMRWNGIAAEVLHPPLWHNAFRQGEQGDYLFLPGRLHGWKRVDLVIKALKRTRLPLKLKIAGVGEAEAELKTLAGSDTRIEFLGRISDEALIDLYSGAFAVPFTPKREDYGYVTLEAFASGKPVITCEDSGEAASIVRSANGGVLTASNVEALANAFESLHGDREAARQAGLRGFEWINSMSWKRVAEQLLDAIEDR